MIISPPFLPPRVANSSDDEWLDVAMAPPPSRLSDTGMFEGSFPLSHNLSWHNGVHIQAPQAAGVSLPVRAITDGEVIFASAPTVVSTDLDHAQNYNPFDRAGTKTAAWTDNGCVIVEHRTTIGAEGAVETEVVFYSLYMHLSALGKITPAGQTTKRALQAGDAIWRKDEIGMPGQIYGHAGQIHFEICFDQENLQRLIGRAPSWVEPAQAPAGLPVPTSDGRTDAIFGSLYFYLPASTPTQAGATLPTHPPSTTGQGATTLNFPLWIKMTYDLGACTFESYDERGKWIAALPAEADVEYEIYTEATHRHASLPAAQQVSSSPNGWYELLRFGRNIGRGAAATDKDPLPVNAAHWRRIPGADGWAVWADLNAPGTFKFSDADFLPVMGWNCIDDDTSPNDQRCDSERIKRLIRDPEATNENRMEMEQLARRLGDPVVGEKLRRVFCKFPSEWDKGTITARYGFVKELQPFKEAPEAWPRLEQHLNGLCFEHLPTAYLAADWRGNPRELVEILRQCLWMSEREMIQLVPVKAVRGKRSGLRGPFFLEQMGGNAGSLLEDHRIHLNRTFRKFGISTRLRVAAFVGNSVQETAWWSRTTESGGPTLRYAPWYGRGFLQLTNPDGGFSANSNYGKYFAFRGKNVSMASVTKLATWRDDVASDAFDAVDSAGAFWAWSRVNVQADNPSLNLRRIIQLDATSQLFASQSLSIYENHAFRRVACLINLPEAVNSNDPQLNGLVDRYSGFCNAQFILYDCAVFPNANGKTEFKPKILYQDIHDKSYSNIASVVCCYGDYERRRLRY